MVFSDLTEPQKVNASLRYFGFLQSLNDKFHKAVSFETVLRVFREVDIPVEIENGKPLCNPAINNALFEKVKKAVLETVNPAKNRPKVSVKTFRTTLQVPVSIGEHRLVKILDSVTESVQICCSSKISRGEPRYLAGHFDKYLVDWEICYTDELELVNFGTRFQLFWGRHDSFIGYSFIESNVKN